MYASLCEGITENRHVYWTNACRPLHPWRFAKELIVSGTFLVSLINTEAFILHFTNPSWKVCIACLDIVFETEKKTSSMVKTIYFRKTALVSHHDYIFLNKCSIHTENVVNSKTIGKLTALLLLSFFYSSWNTAPARHLFCWQPASSATIRHDDWYSVTWYACICVCTRNKTIPLVVFGSFRHRFSFLQEPLGVAKKLRSLAEGFPKMPS